MVQHLRQYRFLFPTLLAAVMALIAIVDYFLGSTASTLNAYEIVRRTFTEPFGLQLPKATEVYIIFQERVGEWALLWAWFLYIAWASVLASVLLVLLRGRGRDDPADRNRR